MHNTISLRLFAACVASFAFFGPSEVVRADEPDAAEAAPDRPLDQLVYQYAVLIPPSIHPAVHDDNALADDPTIVPYSGWHFRDAKGQWAPWMKRTDTFADRFGGQTDWALSENYKLECGWESPAQLRLYLDLRRPADAATSAFEELEGVGASGTLTTPHHFQWDFKHPNLLPDQLRYEAMYRSGVPETVARVRLDSPMPVGNEHVNVTYLGPIRENSEVTQRYRREILQFPEHQLRSEPEIEIHYTRRFNFAAWEYNMDWVMKDGTARLGSGYGYASGPNQSELITLPINELDYLHITRRKSHLGELPPIPLNGLNQLDATNARSRRIELTPEHRFGPPTRVTLHTAAPDAICLLDLDDVRTVALPEDELDNTAYYWFLENEAIDAGLVYINDEPELKMFACPVYWLEDEHWEKTPAQCVAYLTSDESEYAPDTGVLIKDNLNQPLLTTTSDGTMLLFRITEFTEATDEKPAAVVLEVRRLVAPQ